MTLPPLKREVTVVVTSCNRHDLLEATLDSFCRYNTYRGIKEIIVIEDGPQSPEKLLQKYKR